MKATDLLSNLRQLLPSISINPSPASKGAAGRILVIGGCKLYSGAPYFAATAALNSGCELVSVLCTPEAGDSIKSV